jgi:hypothetical protein
VVLILSTAKQSKPQHNKNKQTTTNTTPKTGRSQSGVMFHACNPSTEEANVRGPLVRGPSELWNETLYKKQNKAQTKNSGLLNNESVLKGVFSLFQRFVVIISCESC